MTPQILFEKPDQRQKAQNYTYDNYRDNGIDSQITENMLRGRSIPC